LKNGDIPVAPLSAADFGKMLASETDKFRKLAAGMKLE
jgi:hypothetical protein